MPSIRNLFVAALGLALAAGPSFAADAAAPPGIRGELQSNLNEASDKIVELAGAMPERKWNWRPMTGVRSVAEVYRHIAQANYLMCSFLGAKPPMPMDELRTLDTSPQPREKTIQLLRDSYAFVNRVIVDMPDSDLSQTVEFFGKPMSKEALLFQIASHAHEHLGQSIAYARMNHIVPPWTAREQAAAAKRAAEAGGKAEKKAAEH